MSTAYKKYLKNLFLFSAVVFAFTLLMMYVLPDKYKSPSIAYVLVFFMLSSMLGHHFFLKVVSRKIHRFANFFMLSIFLKLVLYILVIIGYSLLNPQDTIAFIITFFLYYLFYTFFEIFSILKTPKQQ